MAVRVLSGVLSRRTWSRLARCSSAMASVEWETLAVSQPAEGVTRVELNRPKKSNAMNRSFWREFRECFQLLAVDSGCRVVVVSGRGKHFSAGLDLMDFVPTLGGLGEEGDVARKAFKLRSWAQAMQESFTAVEKCPKPVLAAVHGACVGGGVDLIAACDVRLCSADAWFQIKEVDIGLAADVGTLQRLPKVTGSDSLVRELVYTGRKFTSEEAQKMGVVSHVYTDGEATIAAALEMAQVIASKSPVAVQGSKVNLNYSRDHSVAEGLDYVITWNSAMLQSEDLLKAAQSAMTKEPAVFAKL